jgi:hypothetical protein
LLSATPSYSSSTFRSGSLFGGTSIFAFPRAPALLRSWFQFRLGLRFYHRVGQSVRFPKPVGYRRLNLVAVYESNDVNELGFRCAIDAAHLWSPQRAAKEYTDFEKVPLWTHEEIAGFAREHDRVMGRIDPLIPKRNSGLAQPLPGVPQILREITRKSRLSGRPTVVLLSFLNPLFAMVALSTGHS